METRKTGTDWKFMSTLRKAGVTEKILRDILDSPQSKKLFGLIKTDLETYALAVKKKGD